MSASVGGSPIAIFLISIVLLVFVFLLFLYGSYSAYKGAKSKTSLGLLLGATAVTSSTVLYLIVAIYIYNNYGKATDLTSSLLTVCALLFSLGMFVKAMSFVLYVKKHNKFKNENASRAGTDAA